jgi:hypothetical protein
MSLFVYRKEESKTRQDAIREKYGIGKTSTDTVYTVENEKVNINNK